ncbi:MAG TPA: hypothetical protein DIW47_04955 [Bacteroidetes bacterium]|nr:hypothetical protein [Bacteroidota bacterium]
MKDFKLFDGQEAPCEVFTTLYTNTHSGVVIGSLDGRILHCNQAFCELSGYTQDELLNMRFDTITHPADLELQNAGFESLNSSSKGYFRIEKRYIKKSGSIVWVDVVISEVKNKKEETILYVGTVTDINEKKRRLEDLKFQEAAKKKVSSILSHEIRGPIVSFILLFDQLVQKNVDSTELDKLYPNIKKRLSQLQKDLDLLINWSEHQQNEFVSKRVIFDFHELLKNVIILHLPAGILEQIAPEDPEKIFIHGDRDHFQKGISICIEHYLYRQTENSRCILKVERLADRTILFSMEDNAKPYSEEVLYIVDRVNKAAISDSFSIFRKFGLDFAQGFHELKYHNGVVSIETDAKWNSLKIIFPNEK